MSALQSLGQRAGDHGAQGAGGPVPPRTPAAKPTLLQRQDGGLFSIINVIVLIAFSLIIVVPVWSVVVSSFATASDLDNNGVGLFPRHWTLLNYKQVLGDSSIWTAFGISVAKTLVGAVTHVLFCAMVAFAMAKRLLKGRKLYSAMGIVTMFFGGGIIPTYIVIKELGLIDSFWVYIIPSLLAYFDVIILMNFFRAIPDSLDEAAKIDGASDFQIFWKIFLPLSKPALATIALFNGVTQWNDFYSALLYINSNTWLYPMQFKVYQIVVQFQQSQVHGFNPNAATTVSSQGIQLATIVVTALPIVVAYPFLQKHFVRGLMIGAVKG